MGKTYTIEDGESLMAELKSTRGMMAEMKGRLERDEITPDECMFRCIAMGRRHSSHAARDSARLLPTGRKNYKPLPKDDGEGQKEVA